MMSLLGKNITESFPSLNDIITYCKDNEVNDAKIICEDFIDSLTEIFDQVFKFIDKWLIISIMT
jgi:hypothetical protein